MLLQSSVNRSAASISIFPFPHINFSDENYHPVNVNGYDNNALLRL